MNALLWNGRVLPLSLLVWMLLLMPLLAPATASEEVVGGIAVRLGDGDSDWDFGSDTREAQISEIGFQIEYRTPTNLSLGVEIGYFDMRAIADSDSAAENMKFDGQYLGFYLRQPLRISDWLSVHGSFGLRYSNGDESGGSDDDDEDDDEADIDWTSTLFEIGIGLRFSQYMRITPYAVYHDIDGDISGDGTDVFEMDEELSRGIRIDYFTEDTAFVRLDFSTGGTEGIYLSFVRRY